MFLLQQRQYDLTKSTKKPEPSGAKEPSSNPTDLLERTMERYGLTEKRADELLKAFGA